MQRALPGMCLSTCHSFQRSLYEIMVPWVLLFALLVQGSLALKLNFMDVPPHPIVGARVELRCVYDMEGVEVYSVKWYKGGAEFYRYLPKDTPPAQVYDVAGIKVDMDNSDRSKVTLKGVDLASTGLYRCEISAEAPSFTTVSKESEMLVIDLPEDGPKITGGSPKYQLGDTVNVNCTSYRSKPAAILSWTINGEKPGKEDLHEFPPHLDEDGLETSVMGLEFIVRENHFKQGEMKLRCTATIAPIYYQSNEESVIGGNQQASVLESKETLHDRNNGAQCRSWSSWSVVEQVLLAVVLFIR